MTSLSWHPSEDLVITAGMDRKAKLISMPNRNTVQEVFLEDLPISQAQFIQRGKQVLFTGNRKHYYFYDLHAQKVQKMGGLAGIAESEKTLQNLAVGSQKFYSFGARDGTVMVFGQDSKKSLFDLKMNGSCAAMAFSSDEKQMFTVGDQTEIYQWDLTMRKCIGRVADTGSFSTTALAVSPTGNLIATGSKMGSVNLFAIDAATGIEQTPLKSIDNLTTAITDLQFNYTGELLTFSSKWKKNSVKMAHIPSYTVYQNFPGVAPGVLKYPFCGGFSYRSQYYALGTDEGKCHLFELEHFAKSRQ